jgi:nucleotide-binding universal stress UspA family protein
MFHKILVAVDESTQARKAVKVAADLARQYHSSLCLLHALPHVADYLGSPIYEELIESNKMRAQDMLESTSTRIGTDLPVEVQLIEGPPASAILRVAETEGFDLIIMGSRGQGPVVSLLTGSVSRTVSQKAACPVMIVH